MAFTVHFEANVTKTKFDKEKSIIDDILLIKGYNECASVIK